MKERKEKKVLITKTYTILMEHLEDGTQTMTRENDGFAPLELIGLADFIAMEVRDQIVGKIKPNIINRKVIK